MRRDFRIAVLADPGTFIHQIVREFGTVSEVCTDGWPADSEAVIFDCAHPEISRHREAWCRVLDGDKTLGLIGMQAEDRATLEGIVGRPLKASIPSLFVRKFKGDPRGYRYTILPDVARVQAMQPAEVAEFLIAQVFTVDSQNPTVVGPPDLLDNLWPLSSQFDEIRGTRKEIIGEFAVGGGWGAPFPPNSASNATLKAVGHFILANGEGGDGRYHAIILSRLVGVSPLAPDAGGNKYGYGLKLTASVGGNQLEYPAVNVNSTQPIATNTPPPPNWGYIGGFICTEFSGVSIKTLGIDSSGRHTTCDVQPFFREYRAQLTTPGIENFEVFQLDTPNKSEVQFTMWGASAQPANSEKEIELVQLNTEGAEVQSDLALGDEDFVIVHHLDFADPGLPSYNVDFQFVLALYALTTDNRRYLTLHPIVVTVDLVKATALTVVD